MFSARAILILSVLCLALPTFADDETDLRLTASIRPAPTKDICRLPAKPGLCKAHIPRWYYDKNSETCKRFIYGGCGGNANNFESKQACIRQCAQKGVSQFSPSRHLSDVRWCSVGCICTLEYDPVCGKDGNDYGNGCQARCGGTKVDCEGECPCNAGCFCTQQYDPVCGVDGKTYGNSCEASCAKVRTAHKGACPKPPPCPDGNIVHCFADPCQVTKCEAYPNAKCVSNFCGGCNAEFFVNGKRVDCTPPICIRKGKECKVFYTRQGNYVPNGLDCCPGSECCICHPLVIQAIKPIPFTGKCGTRCPVCRG